MNNEVREIVEKAVVVGMESVTLSFTENSEKAASVTTKAVDKATAQILAVFKECVPEEKDEGFDIPTQVQGLRCEAIGFNSCRKLINDKLGVEDDT